MKCCLCRREIPIEANGWDMGNNAEPIAEGRCCNDCNIKRVIPLRIALISKDEEKDND